MKKKKLTFDEIPSTLVNIMDRLAAIEKLLKAPKVPQAASVKVKKEVAAQPGTISADMACKLIGKAKITLYNLAKKGKIPARKDGRNWVFVEAELLEWLRKRKPSRKPGRKPKAAKIVEKPADVVVEKKKRGRPKKDALVVAPPLKLRTGRRPRIVKK
ncbi:MAG: helix-turn-helix domain-containing protein [Bacteroidales bacterium]|nr:helix-turn-helix domain-containing protein [Bacteroidales bacterium]